MLSACLENSKSQIPNAKQYRNSKLEIIRKYNGDLEFVVCGFGIVWVLVLGIWDFMMMKAWIPAISMTRASRTRRDLLRRIRMVKSTDFFVFAKVKSSAGMTEKLLLMFVLMGGVIFFGVASVPKALAADFTVMPAVIDGNGVPNDMLNYVLTVTNTSGRQQNVFASVYELTPSGTQPFMDPSGSNRPALLADWISVSRGAMMLAAGASTTMPVQVQINPYAAAGDYHAVIAFVAGGTRDDAEQHLVGAPQAIVNMAVASNLVASLRVDGFSSVKGFYTSFPVAFHYTIENNGDVASTPAGEIRFYDRLGHVIGSVDANPDAVSIAPGKKQEFSADWANGGGFGQYKAVLDVSYGGADNKLENIALVWVLPWKKLLAIFGSLFVVMIGLALWMHHEYEKRHYRRQRALENLLKKRGNAREAILDLRHPKS